MQQIAGSAESVARNHLSIRTAVSLSLATLAALSLNAAATAQNIEYTKYKLPNGLTVILYEDHSLPIATVNLWYRVGSQDEPTGRTGFAHLFEHLMFMGTKRVPGSDFDILMETGGGANNASTDLHRTNYFSWGPAKLLPTLLWLDADRLEDMGLNMTQEKLDKQRAIVRNELRQVIENRPYGKAEEFVSRLMYPPGHPYHIGTAGLHEDLEAATLTNVKDFFANFYVPNNASLVVAGDFDSARTRPLIDQLFGTLPAGAPVKQQTAEPVSLDRIARCSMLDKVQLPKILITYHSPQAYQDGDAEMKLVADVLTSGKTSRLYKRLVYDEQLAVEVDAAQLSYPLGSLFQIEVTTRPEADLDQVERLVDEEIARLVADGPSAAELDEKRAAIELNMLSELQSLESIADKLNEYEYFWGEPNSFQRDLDRFRGASPELVRNWATMTLTPHARSILRVLPEAPERGPSPRDQRPPASADRPYAPQPPQVFSLTNGVPVFVWAKNELPLVSMALVLRPGGALDRPERAGLADLTTAMLGEGAGDLDALGFAQALQTLGAEYAAHAGRETIEVSLTTLKRNFAAGAALVADAIQRPRFDAAEWQRVKSLHLEELKQLDDEPTAVAARIGSRLLFGDKNPYAWPAAGTVDTVNGLTIDDVRAAYADLLQPAFAAIFVAGDISAAEVRATLDPLFNDWQAAPAEPANRPSAADFVVAKSGGMRVVVVDRPDAVQTVIRLVAPGVTYRDPRRVPLRLLNTILGGSFTSRLNQNLREAHGYTYGARSNFEMDISAGAFSTGASVKTEVTGAALKEFFHELERLRAGDITADEATKAREMVRNNTIQSFAGLSGLIDAAAGLWANNLPYDTLGADLTAYEKVQAAELNALARSAIALDQAVLVLVGDRAKILEQINDLKLPTPVECNLRGDPLPGAAGGPEARSER